VGGLLGTLLSGNALLGLLAAGAWGVGDFSGGMSSKFAGGTVRSTLRVARITYTCSAAVLILAALLRHDVLPQGWPLAAALAAGIIVGFAGTAFYAALAQGAMGASAAASGLLAAAIPALFAIWADGTPGWRRGLGFVTAAIAIWLIAAGDAEHEERQTILLAVSAGAAFGVYFILMKYAGTSGIVWPIAITRIAAVATCTGILFFVRGEALPPVKPGIARWVLTSTTFDTAGNLLFIAATQAGRLDVASVLSSLYPAGTILLAAWHLKERPTRRQIAGMAIAALAVVLITL
jgi:drug/metabolite transporter (DMT)-like permease